MDPITIMAALIPALSDGAKMVFGKFFGSAQPKTVEDVLKLKGSDIEQILNRHIRVFTSYNLSRVIQTPYNIFSCTQIIIGY